MGTDLSGPDEYFRTSSNNCRRRSPATLTVVTEIGARMGRAIAKCMLAGGPDFADTPWPN